MKLSVWAFALTAGILWGLGVFLVALANLQWPDYGRAMLDVIASIYPGYHGEATIGGAIVAAMYAVVDGLVGGAVFACLYNCIACCCCKRKPAESAPA